MKLISGEVCRWIAVDGVRVGVFRLRMLWSEPYIMEAKISPLWSVMGVNQRFECAFMSPAIKESVMFVSLVKMVVMLVSSVLVTVVGSLGGM